MSPATGNLWGMIIAVDGPSGSGKSSTARGVASRLALRFLDTGATYRAVMWSSIEHGLDLEDTAAVAQRARDLRLEISTDPVRQFVIADGTDVTAAIREPRISETVSKIATNLDVRKELIRPHPATLRGEDAFRFRHVAPELMGDDFLLYDDDTPGRLWRYAASGSTAKPYRCRWVSLKAAGKASPRMRSRMTPRPPSAI